MSNFRFYISCCISSTKKFRGNIFSYKHLWSLASDFQNVSKLTTVSEQSCFIGKGERVRRNRKTWKGTGREDRRNEERKGKKEGKKGKKKEIRRKKMIIK